LKVYLDYKSCALHHGVLRIKLFRLVINQTGKHSLSTGIAKERNTMCGIFAYLNYLTPKSRKEILDILIKGLRRLEYRGYDSAGILIHGLFHPDSTVKFLLCRSWD